MNVAREPLTPKQRRWVSFLPSGGDDLAFLLTGVNVLVTGGLVGGGVPALLGGMHVLAAVLLGLAAVVLLASVKLVMTWKFALVHAQSYGNFYGKRGTLRKYSNDLRDLYEFDPELARKFADKLWRQVEQDSHSGAQKVSDKVDELLGAYRRRQRAQQKMSGAASTDDVSARVKILNEQTADLEKIIKQSGS